MNKGVALDVSELYCTEHYNVDLKGKRMCYTHAALPGASRATVARVPRNKLLTPPSLYNVPTTSMGPLY